jgi:MFS family permease
MTVKNKIKKELIFYGILLLVGVAFGAGWVWLENIGVIAPPENPRDVNWWVIGAVIGGGLLMVTGAEIITELLKKHNKKYEIEEKDERNLALRGRASFTAWGLNIGILTAVIAFCTLTGYEPTVLSLALIGVANILCFFAAMVYHNKKM